MEKGVSVFCLSGGGHVTRKRCFMSTVTTVRKGVVGGVPKWRSQKRFSEDFKFLAFAGVRYSGAKELSQQMARNLSLIHI